MLREWSAHPPFAKTVLPPSQGAPLRPTSHLGLASLPSGCPSSSAATGPDLKGRGSALPPGP